MDSTDVAIRSPQHGDDVAMKNTERAEDIDKVAAAVRELLDSMETSQPPKNREEEAAKARARMVIRFA